MQRCRAGELERRQLVVREEILRPARATMSTRPIQRTRSHAVGACDYRTKLSSQRFAQRAQSQRRCRLLGTHNTAALHVCEPSTQYPQRIRAFTGTDETIENILKEDEHGNEHISESSPMHALWALDIVCRQAIRELDTVRLGFSPSEVSRSVVQLSPIGACRLFRDEPCETRCL